MNSNQDKLFKSYKRVIDERSLESMKNPLYEFFHLRCGFIAHYNIHGFKVEYSNRSFLCFLDSMVNIPFYYFNDEEHGELLRNCRDYAREHDNQIHAEFDNKAMNEKMKLLRKLAAELDCEVIPKGGAMPETVDANGQLGLFA